MHQVSYFKHDCIIACVLNFRIFSCIILALQNRWFGYSSSIADCSWIACDIQVKAFLFCFFLFYFYSLFSVYVLHLIAMILNDWYCIISRIDIKNFKVSVANLISSNQVSK